MFQRNWLLLVEPQLLPWAIREESVATLIPPLMSPPRAPVKRNASIFLQRTGRIRKFSASSTDAEDWLVKAAENTWRVNSAAVLNTK